VEPRHPSGASWPDTGPNQPWPLWRMPMAMLWIDMAMNRVEPMTRGFALSQRS
jgi:hypothetical protein